MDHGLMLELASAYGSPRMAELMADRQAALFGALNAAASTNTGGEPDLDDFARCGISDKSDIKDLFVPNFYFGCESDDRLAATAFNEKTNPFGARLHALFSSDIGHFDVMHMDRVLPGAWELVEDGVMTEADFRDFTFTNPVQFWTANSPDFFAGTAVEEDVAKLLS
jgi:hypothetical protein